MAVPVLSRLHTHRHPQVKGAEKVLFGLDDIRDESTIIIVEGELDKLAMEEAGYRNVVSVPDGAPMQVGMAGVCVCLHI